MAIRPLAFLALLVPLGACASPPVSRSIQPEYVSAQTDTLRLQSDDMRIQGDPQRDSLFVSFSAGKLNYTDDDYGPADDQWAIGVAADWSRPGRLGWEIGGIFSDGSKELDSGGDTLEAEGSMAEFYAGPRYNFRTETLEAQPFVGVGVSYQSADRDNGLGEEDTDASAFGAYAHAGVRWTIAQDATIGFDWRYVTGLGDDFTFGDGEEISPNYHLFSFFFGLQF